MTGKKEKAMAMLISGDYKLSEIAAKLKITEKTLYNWRQEDEFEAELKRRLNIKVGTLAAKALRTQSELLRSKSDMVKHLAAKDILDRAGYNADNKIQINGGSPVQIINDIPRGEDDAGTDQ